MATARIYLPATIPMLRLLVDNGVMPVRSAAGFAVTPQLQEFYTSGDIEELEHVAFLEAARASLRLLTAEADEQFPYRRVVVSVDLDESSITGEPVSGEAVVRLAEPRIMVDDIAAIHVDIDDAEVEVARAIEVIDAADLGDEDAEFTVYDALDHDLAWYDPSELPVMLQLL